MIWVAYRVIWTAVVKKTFLKKGRSWPVFDKRLFSRTGCSFPPGLWRCDATSVDDYLSLSMWICLYVFIVFKKFRLNLHHSWQVNYFNYDLQAMKAMKSMKKMASEFFAYSDVSCVNKVLHNNQGALPNFWSSVLQWRSKCANALVTFDYFYHLSQSEDRVCLRVLSTRWHRVLDGTRYWVGLSAPVM